MTILASRVVTALLSALALAGCQNFSKKAEAAPDPAELALVAAAEDISRAWSRSSLRPEEVEPTTSGDASFDADIADPESPLSRRVDMNWFGELRPAIEALANVVGFEAAVIGLPKGPPILVTVDGVDVTVLELLRQAGLQAGARADVVVRESAQKIEVIYRD